jgi:Tfp pilus assembly protein PilW
MSPAATDLDPARPLVSRMSSEGGFTLIELLVSMAIFMVVIGGLLTFIIVELNQGNTIESRSLVVEHTQAGLNQLTQDLNDAVYQVGSTSVYDSVTLAQETKGTGLCTTTTCTLLSFDIPNTSNSDASETVTWTCPYSASPSTSSVGNCVRQVGGSGASSPEMTGIESVAFYGLSTTTPPACLTAALTAATNPAGLCITIDAADISARNSTGSVSVAGNSTPIVIQGGADLTNFQ